MEDSHKLAVSLMKCILPMLFFEGIVRISNGLLNVHKEFVIPKILNSVRNVSISIKPGEKKRTISFANNSPRIKNVMVPKEKSVIRLETNSDAACLQNAFCFYYSHQNMKNTIFG